MRFSCRFREFANKIGVLLIRVLFPKIRSIPYFYISLNIRFFSIFLNLFYKPVDLSRNGCFLPDGLFHASHIGVGVEPRLEPLGVDFPVFIEDVGIAFLFCEVNIYKDYKAEVEKSNCNSLFA